MKGLKTPSLRTTNFAAFGICCALLLGAFYLQIHVGLVPCPLCVVQRLIVIVLGLLFLVGGLLNPYYKSQKIYYSFIFLVVLVGIVAAGRQVWLQSLPPSAIPISCGADLSYLLEVLPINQVLILIFKGTGECAKVTWRLFNLSLAMWTLLFFILFALIALWQTMRKH